MTLSRLDSVFSSGERCSTPDLGARERERERERDREGSFRRVPGESILLRHYRVIWSIKGDLRRLCDPREDTKSFGLSVWSFIFVRSVQQLKATSSAA